SCSFLVTQSPGTVHVSVGDTFTLKCMRELPVTYCYSSTIWQKSNPRTGKITEFISGNTRLEDGGKTCTLTMSNATVQNSGIYYCSILYSTSVIVGNGTRVIVTDPGLLKPSISMYSPSDIGGRTVTLQCLVKGAVPSQVSVAWIIDQSERTGLTESAWTENSDSAEECTRATVTVSTEEWTKATHVECVVVYDGTKISKTLNRDHSDSVCAWLLYAGIGAAILILAVTVALAVWLHKEIQSTATVKGYCGKDTHGKQTG
ncbi:hypothetical protein P4O66_019177, partial [Electrophorus voltai]